MVADVPADILTPRRPVPAKTRQIIDRSWAEGLAASPLPVAAASTDGVLYRVNNAFATLLGRTVDELAGMHFDAVLKPVDDDATSDLSPLLALGLDVAACDQRHVRPDGTEVDVHTIVTVVRGNQRRPRYLLLALADVTEQRRQADDFAAQTMILEKIARREQLSDVLDGLCRSIESRAPGTRCSVILLNPDGRTLVHAAAPSMPQVYRDAIDGAEIGPAAGSCGTAMYTHEEVIVEDIAVHPYWRDYKQLALPHGLRSCWSTPLLSTDTRHGTGRVLGSFAVYWAEPHRPTERERRIVTRAADLTAIAIERDQAEQALTDASLTDPLTGLANRTLFLIRLGEALRRAHHDAPSVAVLYLDVDGFKLINDSMGHDVGDQLLRAIGARLVGVVRPQDTVARLGGDEFTIICEDVSDLSAAQLLAERARGVLAGPFQVAGREVFTTASVGVSIGSAAARADRLVEDADAAMYLAKARGRARVELYDEDLRTRSRARLKVETALRHALDRDEFRLHFQPIVDLSSGRLAAVEALLRWRCLDLGDVPPAVFIPIAEETGMISAIGQWVLNEACRQHAAWRGQRRGAPVIAVNISPRELTDPRFVPTVRDTLARHRVPVESIRLELTETALADPVTDRGLLTELTALGVQLSVDDFGTGHSSLARLRSLAVDELKIDRSFVDGLGTDPGDSAIVAAIIGMASALELVVVAEGVETATQYGELLRLGCQRAQGFLFAPPAPAAELDQRLSGHAWVPTPDHLATAARG